MFGSDKEKYLKTDLAVLPEAGPDPAAKLSAAQLYPNFAKSNPFEC